MIYYLIGDHPDPSWGVGMLYEHVRLLRAAGRDAQILHHQAPFRPTWLDLQVPVTYLDAPSFAPDARDIVVVPEVLAASPQVQQYPWRKIVFVQGAYLILAGLGGAPDYPALGYEAAIAVLPFVSQVVERYFGLHAPVIPPFVAPYFYLPAEPPPRERRVLLAFKDGYRAAGIPDAAIAEALLVREIARRPGWAFERMTGLSHRDTAKRMQSSLFLVNVHSHESFNTTVPEAMAAGCVPLCYEAGAGRDFLRDGDNALVFPNQQVFALVEKLCELMDRYDAGELTSQLAVWRDGGRRTLDHYQPELTAAALIRFFATF